MQTVNALPRDRITLLATSQAISELHTGRLRAEPSRLLRFPSHFGYFLEWAGAQQASQRISGLLPKVEGRDEPPSPDADAPAASHTRSRSSRVAPSPATTVPVVSPNTCGLCGIATGRAGMCHQCWFEKWDSVVQLKNLEQKVAARGDSLHAAGGAATGRMGPTGGAVRPCSSADDRKAEKKRRTSGA
jgi:hypothetical protein